MTSFIGRTINNRYRLDALLGDGGMGTVYRAYDLNLDRTVAIKLMHAHYARQAEFRTRLAQEAKTAAQLDHPSVVRVFDFGDSGFNRCQVHQRYGSSGRMGRKLSRETGAADTDPGALVGLLAVETCASNSFHFDSLNRSIPNCEAAARA